MELFIFWQPDPIAFSLGFWTIKWYGLMWGLGLMAGFFIAQYIFRTLGKDESKISTVILYMLVGGVLGARLAQVIFYESDYFIQHPQKIIAIWEGGLASHGGVIGAILGVVLFCRKNREYPLFWTIDHSVICIMFLSSFIRLGNLINSEIIGRPSELPWSFVFLNIDNIPRHPSVLYESIAYFLIQFLFLFLFKKYKDDKPGLYLVVFLLLVFSIRFILEFLKEPEGAMLFGTISKTQLLNMPFILTGVFLLYQMMNKKLSYKTAQHG